MGAPERAEISPMAVVSLGLVTLFSGVCLPIVTLSGAGKELVNPIWGSVYGGAFWIWDRIAGFPQFGPAAASYYLICGILWPLAITIADAVIWRFILGAKPTTRWSGIMAHIISWLIVLPAVQHPQLPIFLSFFP